MGRACSVTQPCPILCDPMDCRAPGSYVHKIFQTRIRKWVAISSPGDLSDPGIEPMSSVSPALQADSLSAEPSRKDVKWVIRQQCDA